VVWGTIAETYSAPYKMPLWSGVVILRPANDHLAVTSSPPISRGNIGGCRNVEPRPAATLTLTIIIKRRGISPAAAAAIVPAAAAAAAKLVIDAEVAGGATGA